MNRQQRIANAATHVKLLDWVRTVLTLRRLGTTPAAVFERIRTEPQLAAFARRG